jgi:hypothetical protein
VKPIPGQIELNGVANAISMLHQPAEFSRYDIEYALLMFCRYVKVHEKTPILWHDFIAQKEKFMEEKYD